MPCSPLRRPSAQAAVLAVTVPLLLYLLYLVIDPPPSLHPLILIPAYACNQLDARLTAAAPSESKERGWFRLFLNYSDLQSPDGVERFADQMSTVYDPAADDYFDVPGMETTVPHFGSTLGFLYTDPDRKEQFLYMAKLVEALQQQLGYVEGQSLFGAPYDFRYAVAAPGHPARFGDAYLRRLKRLIERASRANGGKPAIILTHSLGGVFFYHFLLRRPLPWRRRFVQRFIAVSATWGGAVAGMTALAGGNSLGLPGVSPAALKQQYASLETSFWPLPTAIVFGDTPLVMTGVRNYSAEDMADFIADVGLGSAGVRRFESRVLPLFFDLPPPRVPVTSVVSFGLSTPERVVYAEAGFDSPVKTVVGDGDGVVNLVSLTAAANEWAKDPRQEVRLVKIASVSHGDIVKADAAVRRLIGEVRAANGDGRRGIAFSKI